MIISEIYDIIDTIMMTVYNQIEEYLENICNAPSTINRIAVYYAVGYNITDPRKRYIMFNEHIVREYDLPFPDFENYYKMLE